MSFDGIMLGHVIHDMRTALLNGRITKIYQLSNYDLLFNVRAAKPHAFLMSTSPKYTRIHLTANTYEKPSHPPMFCMFLRKHFEGAIIHDITQHGNDRVVTITVKTLNELGDRTEKHLIFEALGKDANIIVTDNTHKILEALKHTGPFEEQLRTILPSAQYVYPIDPRVNPFDAEKLEQVLAKRYDSIKPFIGDISGVSPLFIKEYLHRRSHEDKPSLEIGLKMLKEKHYHILENTKTIYYCLSLTHLEGHETVYPNTESLFDAFFYERDQADKRKQKAKDLEQFVKRQRDRAKDKIEKLSKDLASTDDMDIYRIQGELILAHQHEIKKGDRVLSCTNYYNGALMEISLDAKLSAVKNSEQYFKKYKKSKKSIPHINTQIKKTKEDLEYFNILAAQLKHANLADIEEIRDELMNEGYMRRRSSVSKKPQRAHHPIFTDSKGHEILVGKNNLQNAKITHQEAAHFHVWFHVQNGPGSHVVVKKGFPLEEDTIRTAAQLAAYFSPFQHSSSVPVDYTEVKNIKKIPGKRNCFVSYKHQKTIYIDPDESFIKQLKKQR